MEKGLTAKVRSNQRCIFWALFLTFLLGSRHNTARRLKSRSCLSSKINFGGVIIRSDLDGTLHRILHLNTTDVEVGDPVVAGSTQLGTLGGKGQYRRIDTTGDGVKDTSVFFSTGQPVPGNLLFGPDAYAVHIHYDIYLPDGTDTDGVFPLTNWDATDLKIEPIAYWSTGLQTTSIALTDTTGNGLYDTDGILKEGETTTFNVNVNTPHTKDLLFAVTFEGPYLEPNRLQIQTPNNNVSIVSTDFLDDSNSVILKLIATEKQSNPNTSFTFQVTTSEDTNTTLEVANMQIEAGYFDSNNNWVPFKNFDKVTQTVFALDNDTSTRSASVNIDNALIGTNKHDAGSFDTSIGSLDTTQQGAGLSGGGITFANNPVSSTGEIIRAGDDGGDKIEPALIVNNHKDINNNEQGNDGDDYIRGTLFGIDIYIDGGAGNDYIHAFSADRNRFGAGGTYSPSYEDYVSLFSNTSRHRSRASIPNCDNVNLHPQAA